MTSVLLFDVMSTLVYDPIKREIPEYFGLSLEQLYERKHPTAWIDFERGNISEKTFFHLYFPNHSEPIDSGLRRVLFDSYRWLDGMESLLAELNDRDLEIHSLSNYPIWFEIIERKLKLSRFLQWTFVSCRTGFRKPDEQAYLHAISTLGVRAEDCLFVDDRPVNCEAAQKLGVESIVFEGADHLASKLSRRELLKSPR